MDQELLIPHQLQPTPQLHHLQDLHIILKRLHQVPIILPPLINQIPRLIQILGVEEHELVEVLLTDLF